MKQIRILAFCLVAMLFGISEMLMAAPQSWGNDMYQNGSSNWRGYDSGDYGQQNSSSRNVNDLNSIYRPFDNSAMTAISDGREFAALNTSGITEVDDNIFLAEGDDGTITDDSSTGNVDTPLSLPNLLFAFLLVGYCVLIFIRKRKSTT